MAKKPMFCPFTDRICVECPLYRGRHYYVCYCKNYRGYIKSKNEITTENKLELADFEKIKKLLEPWSVTRNMIGDKNARELQIKLKIIDMDSGKENTFKLDEAKTWKWDDPTIMHTVGGNNINSWAKLAEIARYQEEKGNTELVVYEVPRFML
jgi:hypothetical protein